MQLGFICGKAEAFCSGVPRGPAASTGSLASQRHPGKRESSLLWSVERGLGIALQDMQEKKALISRRQGGLGGFTELQRLCWFLRRYDGELREPLVWRQGS